MSHGREVARKQTRCDRDGRVLGQIEVVSAALVACGLAPGKKNGDSKAHTNDTPLGKAPATTSIAAASRCERSPPPAPLHAARWWHAISSYLPCATPRAQFDVAFCSGISHSLKS
jgi:hypothetical protein